MPNRKIFFCTKLIHDELKIISGMSVLSRTWGIGVLGCLHTPFSPSFVKFILTDYTDNKTYPGTFLPEPSDTQNLLFPAPSSTVPVTGTGAYKVLKESLAMGGQSF